MLYRFTIEPRAPFGTPLRSDTLFGHACWSVALAEGDAALSGFLERARAQEPEVVFSDGFPSGFMPRPLLPAPALTASSPAEQRKHKRLSSRRWIKRDVLQNGTWNSTLLDADEQEGYCDYPQSRTSMHNVIDRQTGTSLSENGLFERSELWYTGIWRLVDIYVYTAWTRARLDDFLKTMFETGYGGDRTVGRGVVAIHAAPVEDSFPEASQWSMALSRCIPGDSIDLSASFYALEPKYGKVWSGLGEKNPHKKPLLHTLPGSVFKTGAPSRIAGRVVSGVHDNRDVVENCMSILYPIPAEAVNE